MRRQNFAYNLANTPQRLPGLTPSTALCSCLSHTLTGVFAFVCVCVLGAGRERIEWKCERGYRVTDRQTDRERGRDRGDRKREIEKGMSADFYLFFGANRTPLSDGVCACAMCVRGVN